MFIQHLVCLLCFVAIAPASAFIAWLFARLNNSGKEHFMKILALVVFVVTLLVFTALMLAFARRAR
ncbi:hypothetical protein SAMN03159353_11072 [Cedecea sp. NFIX57]|nr:hypothetical protein SAMN03159353_11072 [Cedecea sp. NFIX57]